jgi:CotS family spore coat protein
MSQKVKLKKYQVKDIILNHYGLAVHSIKSIRGILQVMTDNGCYSFKNAEEFPDLPLVHHCLETIRQNGFPFIPQLVPTLTGETNVSHEGEHYYLDRWVEGHELPKGNNDEESLGKALANFHRASEAVVMPEDSARNGYGKRAGFLDDCQRKLHKWLQNGTWINEFDKQALDFLTYRCRLAYSYIRDVSAHHHSVKAAICHGSLHHENILIDDKDNIWFIDFESLVFAERVFDLAQLIHYYAYPHEWNPDVVDRILHSYQTQHKTPLSNEEYHYFLSYLAFPRRLSNSMIQYFENNPSSKKHYTKLLTVIQQEWPKERFLQRVSHGVYAFAASTRYNE